MHCITLCACFDLTLQCAQAAPSQSTVEVELDPLEECELSLSDPALEPADLCDDEIAAMPWRRTLHDAHLPSPAGEQDEVRAQHCSALRPAVQTPYFKHLLGPYGVTKQSTLALSCVPCVSTAFGFCE